MGTYYEGGAVIAHKARLLIPCGGRGGREHPPLPYIQPNACKFLFLLFSYLRFAEAASFDKKELRRSCTWLNLFNEFPSKLSLTKIRHYSGSKAFRIKMSLTLSTTGKACTLAQRVLNDL